MNTLSSNFQEGRMRFENGILHVEYSPDTIIDENVLYKQIVYRNNLTKEQDFFMVVDLRNKVVVTDEALALGASNPSPEHVKAVAVVTRYGIDYSRIKLYSVFHKPNIKTKAVLSVEEAKLWFESLERESFMRNKKQDIFFGLAAWRKSLFALMPIKLSVLFNNLRFAS